MSNQTCILLLYEEMIPSVKLCAFEQMKYLENKKAIQFIYCRSSDLTQEMCKKSDIVIFVRSNQKIEEELSYRFKKQGKLLIYVMDDDLLNINNNSLSSKYLKSQNAKKRIRNIMKQCSILLTPSRELLEKYGQLFEKVIMIEEPCIGLEQKIQVKNESDKIKIGFAGSIDRAGDVDDLLSKVIIRLLDEYKDKISIEFIGAKPDIVRWRNLNYSGFSENYENYKEKLIHAGWDIGLAPMPDTQFHRCKHYNKYMEYGSAGIIGVYSNLIPYNRIIRSYENGILCANTEEEWYDAISWLINNKEKRMSMIQNIQKDMEYNYTIDKVTESLLSRLPELVTYSSKEYRPIPLNYIKLSNYWQKIYEFIIRNGWDSFSIAISKLKKGIRME